MRTFDDAEALFHETHDPFYLAAFLIQCWLGGLVQRATAEYAEKKNPKDRSLQSGESWRSFLELFELTSGKGFRYLLACLFRFSASDDSPGNTLRRALVPLSVEHNVTGDYFGPKTIQTAKLPNEGNDLARRTIVRWCDWLDAAIHLKTHRRWHLAPAAFDPDPETRELAALGNAQRHIADLDARGKVCWLLDFASAAERYRNSPKWAKLAKGMSTGEAPPWLYPDVDTLVTALWPLVKQYNWTYRDFLNVIRPALTRPNAYPCDGEQDFAAYCPTVLGLHKTAKGTTTKTAHPLGYQIAHQLCPPLNHQ